MLDNERDELVHINFNVKLVDINPHDERSYKLFNKYINTTGNVMSIRTTNGFRFAYTIHKYMIEIYSSRITDVKRNDNKLTVTTKNSTYVFEILEQGG